MRFASAMVAASTFIVHASSIFCCRRERNSYGWGGVVCGADREIAHICCSMFMLFCWNLDPSALWDPQPISMHQMLHVASPRDTMPTQPYTNINDLLVMPLVPA